MQLKRTVTWKVIVTEKFKEETIRELEEGVEQIEQAKTQLDFRARIYLTELQRVDLNQAAEFRRRMDAEKHRQDEMKEQLEGELQRLREIALGEEYPRGQIEGFVDVVEGDTLEARLAHAEVITRDGVIVELREPKELPEEPAAETVENAA